MVTNLNISDLIVKTLEKKRCKKIFFVPGGAIFHLINAFYKSKIELVPMLHEQSCVIAAESYSKLENKIGVALVTAGPGLSNAVTGILSSYVDESPILLLSGNCQSTYLANQENRIYGPQGISARNIYSKITKVTYEVEDKTFNPRKIVEIINKAENVPKGPVVIQIPLDLQKKKIDKNSLFNLNSFFRKKKNKTVFSKKNKNKFQTLFIQSKKPFLLIGGGCWSHKSKLLLKKIASSNKISIGLTWTAKDFLNNYSSSYCGLPGYFNNRSANNALYYSDLFISVGSRLDYLQTGYQNNKLGIKQKILFFNPSQKELKKVKFSNCIKYKSYSEDILSFIYKNLNKFNLTKSWVLEQNQKYLDSKDEMVDKRNSKKICPYNLISTLSKIKDTKTYIAGSSGGSAEISFLNYKVNEGTKFINSPGLGSMGFAIPSIVGALESSNYNNKIITVVGDGGLQFNIQELATISKYKKRKLLIFVLNNDGYDSMNRSLKRYFNISKNDNPQSRIIFPNLKKLCGAYNIGYKKMNQNKNLEFTLKKLWRSINEPTIIEVITKINIDSFPKIAPKMTKKGKIESGSLIDISPILKNNY
jgi:acetolactate synthase-1/2/3 large subunit